jgi:hypothetical protein
MEFSYTKLKKKKKIKYFTVYQIVQIAKIFHFWYIKISFFYYVCHEIFIMIMQIWILR